MVFMIAFAILLLLFGLTFVLSYEKERSYAFIPSGIFCIVLLVIASLVSIMNPSKIYEYKDDGKEKLASTVEIECLNDNLDTEGKIAGNIFVTTGYVNTEQYYYYMYETDKGLQTEKIRAKDTYVNVISDSEKPYIEKYVLELDKDTPTLFGRMFTWWGFGIEMNTDDFEPKTSYYKLYVYDDSITSNYTIDLKQEWIFMEGKTKYYYYNMLKTMLVQAECKSNEREK